MTLGNKIAQYRKSLSITQDALARQLGVTNQAVSKWESDQCCPDVMLLPKLADIFGITLDELFGREVPPAEEQKPADVFDLRIDETSSWEMPSAEEPKPERKKSGFERMFGISLAELDKIGNRKKRQNIPEEFTWPDDNVLRVAVYVGRKMVCGGVGRKGYEYHFDGDVDGVLSCVTVSCGDVSGNVEVVGNLTCGEVAGNAEAGASINCGNVEGNVEAGCDVTCGNVEGNVDAGCNVTCGNVEGNVDAGCTVECGTVGGDIDAGGTVTIRK